MFGRLSMALNGVLKFVVGLGALRQRILALLAVLIGTSTLAADSAHAQAFFYPGTGHYYEVVRGNMSWSAARDDAASRSYAGHAGHLVTLNSAGEDAFVNGLTDVYFMWLGGYQVDGAQEPAGGWTWVTGEPFTYTNWAPGEPNNDLSQGNENRLMFDHGVAGARQWNDINNAGGNATVQGYVVEYEQAAPWPMDHQDRWGSGRAVLGPDPATLTTPWISNKLAYGFPVSAGASLGADGIGYFGDAVEDLLYKFDYRTGGVVATFHALDFVTTVPAIGPSPYVVFCTEAPGGRVFGLDTSVMDYGWFMNTGYVGGAPIIGPDGDTVFGTESGTFVRRHTLTGQVVWQRSGLGMARGSMAFTRDDQKVVTAAGTMLVAFNYSDGSTAWSVDLGSPTYAPGVAPTGEILVGTDAGTEYALNPANGAVLWTYSALGSIHAAPGFSVDGVAYVGSYDHRVYALRVSDGHRNWSFVTGSECHTAPLVGFDGSIYAADYVGDVYRISPAGTQIWQVRMDGQIHGTITIGPDATLYVGFIGDNGHSGLAMVRQQGFPLFIESAIIERGNYLSGGMSDLVTSDDSYYRVRNGLVLSQQEQPVRIAFTTHTPYASLSSFQIRLESAASTFNLQEKVEMFNYSTNAWEALNAQAATTTDSVTTILVTSNASRFVNSGDNSMRVRVGLFPTGALPVANYNLRVDQLILNQVVPTFQP